MAMTTLPYPLDPFGFKLTSQADEDGILAILSTFLTPPRYFVEFGCHPEECNCIELARRGWSGLFMDAVQLSPMINNEWVSASNVNMLLDKYDVPRALVGVMSIDIDGEDIWVWQAITRQPWIVVIEYNGHLPLDRALAWPHSDSFKITDLRYGASLKALNVVGQHKGYHLVYSNGGNAFFVRQDLFDNHDAFKYELVAKPWRDPQPFKDPIAAGFIEVS